MPGNNEYNIFKHTIEFCPYHPYPNPNFDPDHLDDSNLTRNERIFFHIMSNNKKAAQLGLIENKLTAYSSILY